VFTLFFCSIAGKNFLIQTELIEDRGLDYSALDNNNNNMAVQPSENLDETGAGGQDLHMEPECQDGEEVPCDGCNT